MTKAAWNELLARHPEPAFVVALLPDSSEEDRLRNAHSAVRLLVRVIRKLPIQGEFAVAISRQRGQREVVCAFGDHSDAGLMAKITGASAANDHRGIRTRRTFTLDSATEQELTKVAGLPAKRRRPRTTWSQRWEQ